MTDNDRLFLFNTVCNKITDNNLPVIVQRPWKRFRVNCISNTPEIKMRKKAEVLQYNNNKVDISKREKYISAVTNSLRNRKQTWASDKNPNINNYKTFGLVKNIINGKQVSSPKGIICDTKKKEKKFYTYKCDVPGPVMELKYDKSVPVFDRLNKQRRFPSGSNKWPQIS